MAHDAYDKVKPVAEKAGHAVSDAAHKVTDKVSHPVFECASVYGGRQMRTVD